MKLAIKALLVASCGCIKLTSRIKWGSMSCWCRVDPAIYSGRTLKSSKVIECRVGSQAHGIWIIVATIQEVRLCEAGYLEGSSSLRSHHPPISNLLACREYYTLQGYVLACWIIARIASDVPTGCNSRSEPLLFYSTRKLCTMTEIVIFPPLRAFSRSLLCKLATFHMVT